MTPFRRGRFVARFAASDADLEAAQRLRHLAFIAGTGARPRADGRDADAFDARCRHVLVEEVRTGRLVCCFRLLPLRDGGESGLSYAAQYYELSGLSGFTGRMVEMGRFCVHPEVRDPDVLRVAWGAMTRFVDATGVRLLFGCASFPGTDPAPYRDAFALLREVHLAPAHWRPTVTAPEVARFSDCATPAGSWDRRRAAATLPPLLRTYLSMGGRVSDHAVIDRDLGTLHVFVGLEIAAIPPARARALRLVAG